MSQLQRVIVRFGVESDIPALQIAELGWDIDTKTLRVGDSTATPTKILTTKSTGDFDFTSSSLVKFNHVEVETLNGIDFESLNAAPGILVRSSTSGVYSVTSLESSDGSVDVMNADGLNGPIDIRISTQSLRTALAPIIEDIDTIREQVLQIDSRFDGLDTRVTNLTLLSGEEVNASFHAPFTRGIIPDGSSTRQALQILENYAYFVANDGADTLNIQNRTIDDLEVALGTGSFVTIPAAEHDKSGLLSGNDKRKLDYLDISGDTSISEIGVSDFTTTALAGKIVNSNGVEIDVPGASPTDAGLMSAGDKSKLNRITVSTDINLDNMLSTLDDHETRLDNQENSLSNLLNSTIPNINSSISNLDTRVNQALSSSGGGYVVNGTLALNADGWNGDTTSIDAIYLDAHNFNRPGGPRIIVDCGDGARELTVVGQDTYYPQAGSSADTELNVKKYATIIKRNGQWYAGFSNMYIHIGSDRNFLNIGTTNFAKFNVYRANQI